MGYRPTFLEAKFEAWLEEMYKLAEENGWELERYRGGVEMVESDGSVAADYSFEYPREEAHYY